MYPFLPRPPCPYCGSKRRPFGWSNHCPDCGQVAELGQDLSPLAIAAIVIGAIGLAIILAAFFFG